jgi:hypothetical protein
VLPSERNYGFSLCYCVCLRQTTRFPVHKRVWFYTEEFHYNYLEKIQIGLMSVKNIRRFTCDLVQLLGKTPLGENIATIFAANCSITSRGLLLCRVRMERSLPVLACPSCSWIFHVCLEWQKVSLCCKTFLKWSPSMSRRAPRCSSLSLEGASRNPDHFSPLGSQSNRSIPPVILGRPLIHGSPGQLISICWERKQYKDWKWWNFF